jgi:hypothetical protein
MLHLLASLCLALAPQQDLDEQLKELDSLMSQKDNAAQVLESIGRLRVTAAMISNQLAAAENPSEDASKSEMKKIIRSSKRELAKIADNLMSAILHPRRKKITADNMKVWKAAVKSLGQLQGFGAHDLWQIFEKSRKFRDEPEFLQLCLIEIGTTHDYSRTTDLIDLLDHTEYLYIAGAAEALAEFGDAPGKQRRVAVEFLTKYLSEYYEHIQADPNEEEGQRRYRIASQSMVKALTALSGVKILRPAEWTAWWNDNKNKTELWQDKDE